MDVRLASTTNGRPERVLMTGDADYQYAFAALRRQAYSGLVVTHHGAKFSGPVPRPHGAARAVVSYGDGNTYGHPDNSALAAHVGWNLACTATVGSHRRGSRAIP
jgi:competence protein ComEC